MKDHIELRLQVLRASRADDPQSVATMRRWRETAWDKLCPVCSGQIAEPVVFAYAMFDDGGTSDTELWPLCARCALLDDDAILDGLAETTRRGLPAGAKLSLAHYAH